MSKGEAKGDFVTDFLPPVDEFQLSKYMLPAGKVLELKVAMYVIRSHCQSASC